MVGSANLGTLLEMASWMVRLRMVNECFILNNTNLAAIMAKKWPGDYQKLKNTLPPWVLFYVVAGYEVFPEERISSYIKDITDISRRLGVEAVKAVGKVSAMELLKMVKQPSEEPYWKLRYKGASEDVLFLTINDKIEGLVTAMYGLADRAGYSTADMGVYVQPVVQGTGVHCEFNLFYDPENTDERKRVKELSAAAVRDLMAKGAFFSRPYGENAGIIINRDAASVAVLNKIKKMFDPNNVMNTGKLCF
jgi:FAD/FMN-containing dehydrogenase